MGFLGILEDKHDSPVPGTSILNEKGTRSEEDTSGLKHDKGKASHIVLVPQPSNDPNDPLNWPQLKKLTLVCVICFGGIIMAGVYSAMLNPAFGDLAAGLDRSINDVAVLSSYTLLMAGAAGFLVAAFSKKWGKRPVFFFSSVLGTLGSVIGSCKLTYDGILAARIIQGIATSAYESILVSIIGDMYFVHQRGVFMAIIQFILAAVSNFVPVVSGPISNNLGWPWLFRLCAIISAIQTILVFLVVPETNYNRNPEKRHRQGESRSENLATASDEEKQPEPASRHFEIPSSPTMSREVASAAPGTHAPLPAIPAKKTFFQELALFNGTFSNEGIVPLLIAPFAVCLNVAVFWSVVVSGGVTALYVSQSLGLAQIFQSPPYLLSTAGVGYLSLGPFIGALIGSSVMSVINDPIIKWCAVRNKGVYEPEYRLLPVVVGGVFVGVGLMAFGALAQEGRSYYATATMHALTLGGVVIVVIAVSGYALDAFVEVSDDVFVAMIIFKNFVFYGFSWFVNDWIADSGPSHVFYVFGGIAFAMTITTPIVFFFGKRYRSYWSRNNLLRVLRIENHHH